MKIVLKHRNRFSDKWGVPLPIVQELRAYIDNRQEDFDAGKNTPRTSGQVKLAREHVKFRGVKEYYKGQNERDKDLASAKKISEAIAKDKTTGDKAFLRENLKEVLGGYKGRDIVNSKYGTVAQISKNGIQKISSDATIAKSVANGFTIDGHFALARQLLKLFESATFSSSKVDERSDNGDIDIERHLSQNIKLPSGKYAQAKITVKWIRPISGRRIYSIEAIELSINKTSPYFKGAPVEPLSSQSNDNVHNSASISHPQNLSTPKNPLQNIIDYTSEKVVLAKESKLDKKEKAKDNTSGFNSKDWENASEWKNAFESEFDNYWQSLYGDKLAKNVCGRPSSKLSKGEQDAMHKYTEYNNYINACALSDYKKFSSETYLVETLKAIDTRTRKDLILKRSIPKSLLTKMIGHPPKVGATTKPHCFTSCTLGMDGDCNYWTHSKIRLYIQVPKGTPCFVPGATVRKGYLGQREVTLMPGVKLQCVKIDGGDIFMRVLKEDKNE